MDEGIRPPIFGHFFGHKKCPFCPLCAEVLKHEMQTPKNGVVTIMLTKRVFGVEKL
jgi:hypothetical protein